MIDPWDFPSKDFREEVDRLEELVAIERRSGGHQAVTAIMTTLSMQGDTTATTKMAGMVAAAILQGDELSGSERAWLAAILMRIQHEPKSARAVSGAKVGRGPSSYQSFWYAWHVYGLTRFQGVKSKEEAWEQVAAASNKSPSVVKKAWIKWKPYIERIAAATDLSQPDQK